MLGALRTWMHVHILGRSFSTLLVNAWQLGVILCLVLFCVVLERLSRAKPLTHCNVHSYATVAVALQHRGVVEAVLYARRWCTEVWVQPSQRTWSAHLARFLRRIHIAMVAIVTL